MIYPDTVSILQCNVYVSEVGCMS